MKLSETSASARFASAMESSTDSTFPIAGCVQVAELGERLHPKRDSPCFLLVLLPERHAPIERKGLCFVTASSLLFLQVTQCYY